MKFKFVFLLLMLSCGTEVEQPPATDVPESEQIEEKVETTVPAASGPKYPRLKDATASGYLAEFGAQQTATQVRLKTSFGDIRIELFEDTPLHKANFLYLIEREYFCPTELVRIVPGFVIQGGNSEKVEDQEERFLIGDYTIPSEMKKSHLHTSGALAMSRSYDNNPEKRSSAYDFYIVDGAKVTQSALFQASEKNGRTYTEQEKQIYFKQGGAPHLDNEHTVFGRVVSGLNVVKEIAKQPSDEAEWPVKEIEIFMEVVPNQ